MLRSLMPFVALLCACASSPDEDLPAEEADDTGDPVEDPTDWGSFDSVTSAALEAKLDQGVADLGLVGAAMGLTDAPEGQLWTGASGWADVDAGEEWTPDHRFHVGSVTKTFTAALVFQLDEEGLLGLNDPLEDWVPGAYDDQGVTLAHLMSNTSGIVSYNYVGSFNDDREWTPEELVEWAVSQEPSVRFEPGTDWEYSNTNWVLLGLALEAASGESYESLLQDRLLDPLELEDTVLAGSGFTDDTLVACYDAEHTEITGSMDPSMGWAAGALVSTPEDLVRWGAALYGGQVISEQSLEQMTTQLVLPDGTVVEYGMGAFVETDGTVSLYGHTGGYEGYQTYLYHWPTDGLTLVAMANQLESDLRSLAAYGWSVPLDLDYP